RWSRWPPSSTCSGPCGTGATRPSTTRRRARWCFARRSRPSSYGRQPSSYSRVSLLPASGVKPPSVEGDSHDLAKHPHYVPPEELFDVVLAESAPDQGGDDLGQVGLTRVGPGVVLMQIRIPRETGSRRPLSERSGVIVL